jgi:5'(3')-deoxyribonucleotidase
MKSPYEKKFMHRFMSLLCATMFSFLMAENVVFACGDSTVVQARQLFYQSVEDAQTIEKAILLFRKIGQEKACKGLALTYIGALTALRGKYAFSPIAKYRHVLNGLRLMDQGIAKSRDNIEARFIRGMTCFYLPFFFNRKKTAQNDFRTIVKQLHKEYHLYDAQLIMNVTDFLLEQADLNTEEIRMIKKIQKRISENEG